MKEESLPESTGHLNSTLKPCSFREEEACLQDPYIISTMDGF